jgi:G3E family GTPase
VESDVISLANGCICCTIREDLAATVLETINRPERPEYILLEASGVADPSAIILTFGADCFRDRIRLDSIICVVDAEQVLAVPELMELKIRQIAFADLTILNKVDLVDRADRPDQGLVGQPLSPLPAR